jgi:hypothetical protein
MSNSRIGAVAGLPVLRASAAGVEGGVFAPLIVEVTRSGVVVKRVELPDPREVYCREFNESAGFPGDLLGKVQSAG